MFYLEIGVAREPEVCVQVVGGGVEGASDGQRVGVGGRAHLQLRRLQRVVVGLLLMHDLKINNNKELSRESNQYY